MAFKETELALYKATMDKYIESIRPPIEMRNKIDIGYQIKNQTIEIFEKHKSMNNNMIEEAIAKTTYLRNWDLWKVYWRRADMKWHLYEPKKEVRELSEFIKLIEEDNNHCFWG